MQNNIKNHNGRFVGLSTKTQKRVHCAKVFRITPHFIKITDRNDGKDYTYNLNSVLDVRF